MHATARSSKLAMPLERWARTSPPAVLLAGVTHASAEVPAIKREPVERIVSQTVHDIMFAEVEHRIIPAQVVGVLRFPAPADPPHTGPSR
eukprot:scaffold306_cov525-Prasinococcus_capsulatus_cf.AAC.22